MVVFFGKAAFGGGDVDGLPDGGLGHGFGGAVQGLAQGDAGVLPSAADAGEEPFGVLVAGVEPAQAGEEFGSDGNFARLAVFGLGNEDDETLAVDVAGFDGECLAQAQSALIDDGAVGTVASVAKRAQEQGDLKPGVQEQAGCRLRAGRAAPRPLRQTRRATGDNCRGRGR